MPFGAVLVDGLVAWAAGVPLLPPPQAASTVIRGMAATAEATRLWRRCARPDSKTVGVLAVIVVAPGLSGVRAELGMKLGIGGSFAA